MKAPIFNKKWNSDDAVMSLGMLGIALMVFSLLSTLVVLVANYPKLLIGVLALGLFLWGGGRVNWENWERKIYS